MDKTFAVKGDILYSLSKDEIKTQKNGYVICDNGLCVGTYDTLPAKYSGIKVFDYSDKLVIPGMSDLHLHAPQYTFRGIGMNLELLDWLNTYTFPEEANYADIEYAKKSYSYFTYDLMRSFTTRAVIFATIHNDATIELMDQLDKTGVISYVGRVNMDRNGGKNLEEASASESLASTIEWLDAVENRYKNTFPILTPRFIPSCSDELMLGLGKLSKERSLRIQSHLSENPSEIEWVKDLVKESSCYANAYELFDTMGSSALPTIMAHCVYSDEKEIEILKNHGAFIAHCSDSNMNLSSGIAPVRKFLDAGVNVGLGTDVSAGSSLNMVKAILNTIQASKMYFRLVDNNAKALSFEEAFYLATKGGGKYFGNVGSFEKDYEFDLLVIDDSTMHSMKELTIQDRMERVCYNDADAFILKKFVAGCDVFTRA